MSRTRRAHRLFALVGVPLALALSGPAGAQGALVEGPSVVVTGLGVARAPAETANLQLLLASAGDFRPAEPAIAPPEGVPPEAGTPPAGAADQPAAAEPGFEDRAGAGLAEADLAPVVAALVAAGAAEEDVRADVGSGVGGPAFGSDGPPLGRVEAVLRDPTEDGVAEALAAAEEAAAAAGLAILQAGAAYDVADCGPLLREARQQAIERARTEAEELAELVGGGLGELLQVSSSPAFFGPPVVEDDGGCPPSPETGYYGPGSPAPYDPAAPAEARAHATVTLTYALESVAGTPAT